MAVCRLHLQSCRMDRCGAHRAVLKGRVGGERQQKFARQSHLRKFKMTLTRGLEQTVTWHMQPWFSPLCYQKLEEGGCGRAG